MHQLGIVELNRIDGTQNAIRKSHLQEFKANIKTSAYSIKWVERGAETYFVEGEKIKLVPGHVFICAPGIAMQATVNTPQPTIGHCIDIDLDWVEPGSCENKPKFIHLRQYAAIPRLFSQKLGLADGLIFASDVKNWFADVADWLSQYNIYTATHQSFYKHKSLSFELHIARKMLEAKDFMDVNGGLNISLCSLANDLHISMRHFNRLFKHYFGTSPGQYVLHLKMQTAKTMIENGHPLTEVAMQCGYSDYPSFSRAYKAIVGLSPSQALH